MAMYDERHLNRERVLNLIFEAEMKELSLLELVEQLPVPPSEQVRAVLAGIEGDLEQTGEMIEGYAKEWSLERMPAIDRALLRMAIYELQHTDVPKAVVLNEAVELAKQYSTADSSRFINGILASAVGELRNQQPDSQNSESQDLES